MPRDFGDDPRDFERVQSQSSNRTLWIILCIVGGVLLICGGGITAVFFGVYYVVRAAKEKVVTIHEQVEKQMEEQQRQAQAQHERVMAQDLVDKFLSNLRRGFLDVAYNDTSTDFRKRMSAVQFRQFVDKNAVLKANALPQIEMQASNDATSATAKATLTSNFGQRSVVTLRMVKENGFWKVDDLTIP
jgi:hypothetical protein